MKNTYNVYDVRKHPERNNWWVVDGERGICTYEADTAEEARTLYENGKQVKTIDSTHCNADILHYLNSVRTT